MDLEAAIKSWDVENIRNILDETQELTAIIDKINGYILHMIYMGIDLEELDEAGNPCILYAAKNEDTFICDILLQCGADMWATTKFYISVYEYVNNFSSFEMKEVFQKYCPGLWKAVECENIYQVRRLINLWCRTNLSKNGVMLKDIALNTGNEEIISLILGIFDSMKLVYHIFAKNTKAVSNLLETKRQRVRLDLRKMSDKGAPIMYYLIQSEDVDVIELFIKYGCQLYTIMQDDFGCDMPVLFSALKPGKSVSVIEALLPPDKQHQEEMLFKILYQGQTILEVALTQNVSLDFFNVLIDRGGPLLLCERNQVNQTVRDLAFSLGKEQYVDVIDSNISSWILHPGKYPGRREKVAMYGWNLDTIEDELKKNSYMDDYFVIYKSLQVQMELLANAIVEGDMETFSQLTTSLCESEESAPFLWYGKVMGDEKPAKESIDNLFDQNRRTALHYAYASASMKEIKSLLMSYGCSEHVLDKVNREPLDFKDKQDTNDMMELLCRLKLKDFTSNEIDPWRVVGLERNSEQSKDLCYCEHSEESCDSENEQFSDYESESSEEEEMQTARSCSIS
ncbi:hypothetical protein CEXT_566142 [Caerostris extrusa]|uniref:Ankyrin repeat-containing protein n=1 Tax=Caerostris extrusa TaxID=172846 RepID=A0AAV4W8Z0_CAEEX|nr:hypothetical protein CEXT_566142 [Caerostris extrusa]